MQQVSPAERRQPGDLEMDMRAQQNRIVRPMPIVQADGVEFLLDPQRCVHARQVQRSAEKRAIPVFPKVIWVQPRSATSRPG